MYTIPPELLSLYPFRNTPENYLKLPCGNVMHFVDEGQGAPILMLHGNPTWSFLYRDAIKALRKQYRCIAPDHIGCGLSEKPANYPYQLDQHIKNIVALIEHLNLESFHLMVHDWGGPIGFGVAQYFSNRLESIIVTNTTCFLSNRIPGCINLCRMPLLGEFLIRGLNAFALGATYMCTSQKMDTLVRKGFCFPYNNWPNRIALARFVKDIPMRLRHPSYARMLAIEERLPLLQDIPMLICWGGKDFCFNDKFFEGFKERFPQAQTAYFPQAGHYLLEDAGQEIFPKIKDFLQEIAVVYQMA